MFLLKILPILSSWPPSLTKSSLWWITWGTTAACHSSTLQLNAFFSDLASPQDLASSSPPTGSATCSRKPPAATSLPLDLCARTPSSSLSATMSISCRFSYLSDQEITFTRAQMNRTMLPVMTGGYASGTSSYTVLQYAQGVKHSELCSRCSLSSIGSLHILQRALCIAQGPK